MDLASKWADAVVARHHGTAGTPAAAGYYRRIIEGRWPGGPGCMLRDYLDENPFMSDDKAAEWLNYPPPFLVDWVQSRVPTWFPGVDEGNVGVACFAPRRQSTCGVCTCGVLGQDESVWDLFEKILMRELTRRRGPTESSVTAATDAVNAATAAQGRKALEEDGCGAGSQLMKQAEQAGGAVDWRVLACFAAKFAELPVEQRAEVVGTLQNGGLACLSLLANYRSLLTDALPQCAQAVMSDPAYASTEAMRNASWNPYDPNAGDKWLPSVPGGQPPGGQPTTPDAIEVCIGKIDAHMPPNDKLMTCGTLMNASTTVAALELGAAALDAQGYPKAAAMYREEAERRRQGGQPTTPQPTAPNWTCNPFPACLAQPGNWPSTQAHPCEPFPDCVCEWLRQGYAGIQCPTSGTTPPTRPPDQPPPPAPPANVNWGCQPFPQCLADPTNWPQGVAYPCDPWPSCAPAYLAALAREGNQPGAQPEAAQPKEVPWYKTTWGMVAIGAGAVVGVGAIVMVAAR